MSKIDTKGLGKAAAKAFKAGKLPPGFALKPIQKPEPQPRAAGRFVRPPEDHRRTALSARCRRYGIAANAANRDQMDAVHMCCDLGFVMHAAADRSHIAGLWDVFSRWVRAEVVYRTRYLGQGEQPASAALQMIPDAVTTDQSHTVDLRTPDERDRDAVNSWMRWQGCLGKIKPQHAALLQGARRGDGALLWRDGGPTRAGLDALDALRDLASVA